eukprot:178997-Pleurochrysis_carterae.AAC.1
MHSGGEMQNGDERVSCRAEHASAQQGGQQRTAGNAGGSDNQLHPSQSPLPPPPPRSAFSSPASSCSLQPPRALSLSLPPHAQAAVRGWRALALRWRAAHCPSLHYEQLRSMGSTLSCAGGTRQRDLKPFSTRLFENKIHYQLPACTLLPTTCLH